MPLRWYQQEAVDAALQHDGNGVIELPTGSGKSHVIAELCHSVHRSIVLQHRKELIEQNAAKLRIDDIGIYSAGLRFRQTRNNVVLAGIQSCYKRALEFGQRDLCIVDECHLVANDGKGMYHTFFDELRRENPLMRFIGLTATPYRTQQGDLVSDGTIWDKVVYRASVKRMINDGYLCPIINSPPKHEVDLSGVKIARGEYHAAQAEQAFLSHGLVYDAVKEIVAKTAQRKSVLIFTSGLDHMAAVKECLENHLIALGDRQQIESVDGGTLPLIRQSILDAFKAGRLKYLLNCDVLTTGFDAPRIDCVVVLRATTSAGLFAQMVGRGFRLDDAKQDCCVLDFGTNIRRHGCLDDPNYGRLVAIGNGTAPTKLCIECEEEIPAGCVTCPKCGAIVVDTETLEQEAAKHEAEADEESEIFVEAKPPEWVTVEDWRIVLHVKRGDTSRTMRVEYMIDGEGNLSNYVNEYVCIEHEGYAKQKADAWMREHSVFKVDTIEDGVEIADRGGFRMPSRIQIQKDGKWWRVLKREFDCERPSELKEVVEEEEIPF